MIYKRFIPVILIALFIIPHAAFAVDVAPRISDREIVESLAEIKGKIEKLDAEINGKIEKLDAGINGKIEKLDAGINGKIEKLDAGINGKIEKLEEGQKTLETSLNKRIDDLRSEMSSRFVEVNHRFVEVNHRFEEVDNRFDTLQWMLGLFITIALVIFGFILRMQWQMHRRQAQMETLLETQRDELSFIKSLIEKFLPPKGVL